jgi:hypothetical protein
MEILVSRVGRNEVIGDLEMVSREELLLPRLNLSHRSEAKSGAHESTCTYNCTAHPGSQNVWSIALLELL